MKKIKLFQEQYQGEVGEKGYFSYYLLVEEVEHLGFFCENYGVGIGGNDGTYEEVLGISPQKERIESLLGRLRRNKVSPISLGDVLADWL